jgi:hypothetical protein
MKNDITPSLSFPSSLLASLGEMRSQSSSRRSLGMFTDAVEPRSNCGRSESASATRSMVDARFGGVGARGGSYDF